MADVIWTPQGKLTHTNYDNEEDLEKTISLLQTELFGSQRVYLNAKKKIGVKGGIQNIPDGYLIDLTGSKPRLYVVESELASHDPLRHIVVQLMQFAHSFTADRRIVKNILFDEVQKSQTARERCEKFIQMRNYRNLDHLLDTMVNEDFSALVIIDEIPDLLEMVLIGGLKFAVELLQISRYSNEAGVRYYRFEPFLADVIEDLTAPTRGNELIQVLDVEDVDTIVVPAQADGFRETFLGENRWHAIRIHGTMRPQIKYIAAYQVRPISAITHIASVSSIEPWGDTGKFVVNFSEPAREITPIELVPKGRVKALQNIRYTTLKRLEAAKTLDEVW